MKMLITFTTIALAPALLAQSQVSARVSDKIVLMRTNDRDWPARKFPPLVLPDGRMVVSVADTVYMLTPKGELLWKYATAGETLMAAPAFNADLNELAIIGYDLLFERIDATTGKVKWKADSNGRAEFVQVAAYQKGFLVVVDMTGYRENDKVSGGNSPIPNQLEYWTSSNSDFWKIDFPVDAELVVAADKIYAMTYEKDKIQLHPLHAPRPKKAGTPSTPRT